MIRLPPGALAVRMRRTLVGVVVGRVVGEALRPCLLRLGVPKSCLRGDLRARAAMQAPQSPPSSPLGACGTWGPPPDIATVRNRHWRLLGLQNDPNGGWAARQSPTWRPTTWPQAVPPHSPTAPPGSRGGSWERGLWHTTSDGAAWLGLAGPGVRLPARNRPRSGYRGHLGSASSRHSLYVP